ncbi:hypothetical protein LZ023_31255 [Pseudomonas silvicola]|nr:hypothetical protein LZ023_31255 [Pseudomonas silvicola]
MITSYLCNALTHSIGKAYDEFVSRTAGVNSLFQWAHIFDRLVQGERFSKLAARCVYDSRYSKSSTRIVKEASMMPHSRHFIGANSVTNIELNEGFLPAPIVENEHWLENPHRQATIDFAHAISRGALARRVQPVHNDARATL